jgi:phosphatidylserine/phosphatidylglycerophosphate/cardiolipin synthase-like enzyme
MKFFSIVLLVGFFLVSCGENLAILPTSSVSSSSITVFFSKPGDLVDNNYKGGPEEHLVSAINHASSSIDMAIYELSLDNITESLLAAQQRNVHVRVFTDSDHLHWDAFTKLKLAGIEVKGDERSALMHNKFTIIDNKEVWTGSMNLTYYGAYRHNENLIQVSSTQVALNYTEEFSQLWAGVHNQANAADNYLMVGSTPVDIHFSPDDDFRETRLLPLLQQATQSVHLMAFSFTSNDIAAELLRLKAGGVEVKVVLDKGQSGQRSSQYDDLLAQDVDIRRDGNPYKLHHKVIIIDQRYVVTGSYNFSQNAESRNDENSVVIDDITIADQFEVEFDKVYQQGILY